MFFRFTVKMGVRGLRSFAETNFPGCFTAKDLQDVFAKGALIDGLNLVNAFGLSKLDICMRGPEEALRSKIENSLLSIQRFTRDIIVCVDGTWPAAKFGTKLQRAKETQRNVNEDPMNIREPYSRLNALVRACSTLQVRVVCVDGEADDLFGCTNRTIVTNDSDALGASHGLVVRVDDLVEYIQGGAPTMNPFDPEQHPDIHRWRAFCGGLTSDTNMHGMPPSLAVYNAYESARAVPFEEIDFANINDLPPRHIVFNNTLRTWFLPVLVPTKMRDPFDIFLSVRQKMGYTYTEIYGNGKTLNIDSASSQRIPQVPDSGDHVGEVEWVCQYYKFDGATKTALVNSDISRHGVAWEFRPGHKKKAKTCAEAAASGKHTCIVKDRKGFELEIRGLGQVVTQDAMYEWIVFCIGLFHIDVLRSLVVGKPFTAPNIRGLQRGEEFFVFLWIHRKHPEWIKWM